MKVKPNRTLTKFSHILLILILVFEFTQTAVVNVYAQAPGVIVIISSDTIWTKTESPYNLTGPLLVKENTTLTIEAGTTVDLNEYYIAVNGTLRVLGNKDEQVQIINGNRIEFTEHSISWNETDFGSILEYATINTTLTLKTASPKIQHCETYGIFLEGQSSPVISNNKIYGSILFGSHNIVMGFPIITNNTISNGIGSNIEMYGTPSDHAGSPTITQNTINGQQSIGGIHIVANSPTISSNTLNDSDIALVGKSLTILNNKLNGSIDIKWSEGTITISNNKITPPSRLIESPVWIMPDVRVWYFGIFLEGKAKFVNAKISNNTISGCSSGIKIGNIVGQVNIENNTISDNVEDGINIVAAINMTITGNFIKNNTDNGIKDYWGQAKMTIRNNTITNNNYAITDPGPSTIERNIIHQNKIALDLGSQATIQNNTITETETAIRLHTCPFATINYNNIENYTQNSIQLANTTTNIDAKNNWWGTTNTQTINLTIRDYKYEYELGKVNFTPILTTPNTKANSDPIPEYPTWTPILITLIATMISTLIYKKNLTKKNQTKTNLNNNQQLKPKMQNYG